MPPSNGNLIPFTQPTVGPVRPWVKLIAVCDEFGNYDRRGFQEELNAYIGRLSKTDAVVEALTFSHDQTSAVIIYHSLTQVI